MFSSKEDPAFRALVEGGVPLADLERRLRPSRPLDNLEGEAEGRARNEEIAAHAGFKEYSNGGFLGSEERLLDVVWEDWQTLERYGITHAAIADAFAEALPRYEPRRLVRTIKSLLPSKQAGKGLRDSPAFCRFPWSPTLSLGLSCSGRVSGTYRPAGRLERAAWDSAVGGGG